MERLILNVLMGVDGSCVLLTDEVSLRSLVIAAVALGLHLRFSFQSFHSNA